MLHFDDESLELDDHAPYKQVVERLREDTRDADAAPDEEFKLLYAGMHLGDAASARHARHDKVIKYSTRASSRITRLLHAFLAGKGARVGFKAVCAGVAPLAFVSAAETCLSR